jgi:ribonuclease HII
MKGGQFFFNKVMKYSTFSLEYALFTQGCAAIGGIDEVGRGCLAGPVVAAAVVIRSPDTYLPGIFDSKLMTRAARERVYELICRSVDGYGVGTASVEEIDGLGISRAAALAMARAYGKLLFKPDVVIFDGKHIRAPALPCLKIDKADQKHYVVSAASVLAKVYRDRLMCKMAERYPEYGFDHHVGYGTKQHFDALRSCGVCEIHRKSYAPVKRAMEGRL